MNLDDIVRDWSHLWLPPERLNLAAWAEKHFVLSPEYSALTNELRLFGWQREIFDSFTDPTVNKIVLKVGTQLVKTLFIQAAIAFVMAEVPGPVLLIQPKDDDARTFSHDRLSPMLRDIPALQGKVSDSKRNSGSTIFYKSFPGGNITLVGSLKPGNMARRSIQYLFADEVNKYPASVGDEGSPLALAEERSSTFGTRAKIVYACSPTVETAAISREYAESDQREAWCACWKCGELQVLKWGQVRWDSALPREEQASSARYICEHCGAAWTDLDRWKAADQARWIARKPFIGAAGFCISHLCSPYKTLAKMVATFLKAKASNDVNGLRVFVNTNLAEEWKEKGEAPEWRRLMDRREAYETGTVPEGVLFLTAAVDVQADRLKVEVKGWGRGRESWSIAYEVIQPLRSSGGRMVSTRTSEPEPWDMLAALLQTEWQCAGGGTMQVWCTAVDTGYSPQNVYDFCHRFPQPAHGPAGSRVHSYLTVVPIKGGDSEHKLIQSVSDADAARKRQGLKVVWIGTHSAKQEIYDSLRLERGRGERGPGYSHHPEQYGEDFFRGLCAESRLVKANGDVEWRRAGRNEPLDLHVYNRASAELCGISRFSESDWLALEKRRAEAARKATMPPDAPAQNQAPADLVAARQRWIPERRWFT
jgi:phage terminase large subunit GpA-like protein